MKSSKSFVDLFNRSPKSSKELMSRQQRSNLAKKNSVFVTQTYNNTTQNDLIYKLGCWGTGNKSRGNNLRERDVREKDLMKKLIFDNQEIMRKAKELEKRCSKLELENKELTEMYEEVKWRYLKLKQNRESPDCDRQNQGVQNSHGSKESGNGNILGFIFKGMAEDKVLKENNKPVPKVPAQGYRCRPSLQQYLDRGPIPSIPQLALINQNEINESNSESQMSESVDNHTQTQIDGNSNAELCTKVKELELKGEISTQKIIIQDLEKKYSDVLVKYERIKSIIGGTQIKSC